MLDVETKRRIDTARDILVGKVPDPKSQVEQITIALIYKFMDDMDVEAEELGGERTFFRGSFAKYAWRKIFDPRIGGFELLSLYGEAITKMDTNPDIPALFRNIFKNAYLPYRDPETLKIFLKVINDFEYTHSEKLGDAFEYLLSVLGSQGDAGQFRTPRHIIDFMVEIMNPQKHETIHDPACGTAGFLISSFKHVIKQNSSNYNPEEPPLTLSEQKVSVNELVINNTRYKGDKLTADDRNLLAGNIFGYDISPDMVRLSLVNMYLHGIKEPHISEYDTLTSEDNWNKYADVILANPPFMSPKGGIRPHKRFSVQSNRSEVLFVDYIAEHLTPNGRAAVIVPEGIIFQSGNAYKTLRKLLVENYLVGVISLPAGVFQPYSGVKTSILWLDKRIAKSADKILFVKIENDGFDLGAQRRAIKENDLPLILSKLYVYLSSLQEGGTYELSNDDHAIIIGKSEISGNGECSLSGEKYKKKIQLVGEYPLVKLGTICNNLDGKRIPITQSERKPGNIPYYGASGIVDYVNNYIFDETLLLVSEDGANLLSRVTPIAFSISGRTWVNNHAHVLKFDSKVTHKYVEYVLNSISLKQFITGSAQPKLNQKELNSIEIPLPSPSVQQEIVEEIEGYQKIIDGARMVVDNYKPRIAIDPEWEIYKMQEVALINPATSDPIKLYNNDAFVYVDISSIDNKTNIIDFSNIIAPSKAPSRARRIVKNDDILMSTVRPNLKAFGYLKDIPDKILASTGFAVLRAKDIILPRYLFYLLFQHYLMNQMISRMGKGAYPSINQSDVEDLDVPVPPIKVQKSIIEELEMECSGIEQNRLLIKSFEAKIKSRIAKVWGSDD